LDYSGTPRAKAKSGRIQQSRADLRIISSWHKPEVHQTLKIISAERKGANRVIA
jgi:hypothetical protein